MRSPADQHVSAYLAALEAPVAATGAGTWVIGLEAAGHPLQVELELRGELLRASAGVLPAGMIDPHQLLFWNRQAPLVCFAESAAGEVLVSGELPLQARDAELLDRFLGLLHASAARAREFVLGGDR